MSNDLNLQAPWIGESDLDCESDYDEEERIALAYDDYIESIVEEELLGGNK